MESAVYHEWKAADERRRTQYHRQCLLIIALFGVCGCLLTQAISSKGAGAAAEASRPRSDDGDDDDDSRRAAAARDAASAAVATQSSEEGGGEEYDGAGRRQAPGTQLGAFEVVWLPIGQVRGTREVLLGGSSPHFSPRFGRFFRGIPYGRARRFEPPGDPEPQAVIDATRFRRACLRPNGPWYEDMAEDCLHLNVFAPSHGDPGERSPVAVWFHGGSYTTGAGDDAHREHVAALVGTLRVVVVTVNYRLGVLGFLGSDRARDSEHASTGNFGTLDQQLALAWVRRHIAHFGGDNTRITVFGWSAGAAAASAHLAMPSSEGLFSSVVMMSGGFVHRASRSMAKAEEDYNGVLAAVGCSEEQACQTRGPVCACLKQADAGKLISAEQNTSGLWAPTVDGVLLPRSPDDALKLGHVHRGVPVIIGSTIEDASVDIGAGATPETLRRYFQDDLMRGSKLEDVDRAVALYLSSEELADIQSRRSHDGWSPAYWAARRATADRDVTCVARRSARRWEHAAGAPAFWYLWTEGTMDGSLAPRGAGQRRLREAGRRPPELKVFNCWPCPGATHGADLPYLFQEGPTASATSSVAGLLDMYHTFFADFLRHGDPNLWLGGLFLTQGRNGRPAWPPAGPGGVLFEAGNVSAAPSMRGTLCDFWDAMSER